MKNKNYEYGFTLIELLISITIFSFVVTAGFYAFSAVSAGKIKIITKTSIEKEAYYFSERLFEEIKKGGTIDYEEYFNRNVVNLGHSGDLYLSGHYKYDTGFGNFGKSGSLGSITYGSGYYFCRSGNSIPMGTGGCLNSSLNDSLTNMSGTYQRFGEYTLQFVNLNSDSDSDLGDENGDGKIFGDDDDEYIGNGPKVFSNSGLTQELYLISGDKKKRTLFRRTVKQDPAAPASATCSFVNQQNPTGLGCLGDIEFLKLDAKDLGLNHDKSGSYYLDGVPESWIINPDFSGTGLLLAGSNTGSYWMSLFPQDTVSITNLKFYLFPNKDMKLAWKDSSSTSNFSPYLRISFSMRPSYSKLGIYKGIPPTIDYSTTISLSDVFSRNN